MPNLVYLTLSHFANPPTAIPATQPQIACFVCRRLPLVQMYISPHVTMPAPAP